MRHELYVAPQLTTAQHMLHAQVGCWRLVRHRGLVQMPAVTCTAPSIPCTAAARGECSKQSTPRAATTTTPRNRAARRKRATRTAENCRLEGGAATDRWEAPATGLTGLAGPDGNVSGVRAAQCSAPLPMAVTTVCGTPPRSPPHHGGGAAVKRGQHLGLGPGMPTQ
jgi:hypothetical protein